MAASLLNASVVAFLTNVPPFQFLPEEQLERLAGRFSLEYFPRNTVILTAGGKPADRLYVVQKGGVKLAVQTDDGEEVVIDVRSEGGIFGLLSALGGEVTRLDVTAIEDTLCYSVPVGEVQRLIAEHPEFAAWLLRTSVTRYMDHSLAEIRARTRLLGEGERLLYSLSANEVARKPALACGLSTSVQHAARMMREANATCIFVVNGDGNAVGVITDKDFTVQVIARGLPLDTAVALIMSQPVVSVEGSERVFDVLVRMLSSDIHHVLVTESGLPKRVITHHDLMLLQGKSPLSVARHIERQETLADLVAAQRCTSDVIPLLMREGARASHITRVIAELNDRVLAKIFELAHRAVGPAPVPYCFVTLGSDGRREQTFKTDQDNALIYQDTDEGTRPAVEDYFARLTAYLHDALAQCGYPSCRGGFMASNPRWRKGLSEWKEDFRHWITDPVIRGVQDALIFFDMRAVAGDASLLDELHEHNQELLRGASLFKSVLAWVSINHKPPLGFFRTFVVEQSGEHKNELDVKLFGTWPIVNAARLYALENNICQTNTIDRLNAIEAAGFEPKQLLKDLADAFEFLTMLRLERQLQQIRAGEPAGNYISPATLSQLQRSLLKEAFRTIARVQEAIESRYKNAVWQQLRG